MGCRIVVAFVALFVGGSAGGLRAEPKAIKPETKPDARRGTQPDPKADARPASKPSPTSKPAPTDETAVRAALKVLSKGLQDGDPQRIRHAIYAANADEKKMVDAMASMAEQIALLFKAATKAFGEEQAKGLTGDLAAEVKRIDEARVVIEGDTAAVRYADPSPVDKTADSNASPQPQLTLKKLEGRWQLPMAELSKGSSPQDVAHRLADLASQTKVIAELVTEVAGGKFKSADQAAEAWQAKMMQALTPPRKPTTDKSPATAKSGPAQSGPAQPEPAQSGPGQPQRAPLDPAPPVKTAPSKGK